MSLEALTWAFNLELPNSGAKLTLLALANFANEHGEAYPSQKAISAKTCLSDRAIRRHLVTLEELGIIFRKPRKRANGSYSSDLFQIHVGGGFADGKFLRRPNWPEVENEHIQRPNRPAAKLADGQKQQRPAAKLAAPETSLNTTITKSNQEPQITNVISLDGSKKITFKTWLAILKAKNERPISGYKPVWDYAERLGIDRSWVEMAWIKFHARYLDDATYSGKRYIDWRRHFLNAIEGNWFNFWRVGNEGNFVLTTAGIQADIDTREHA